MAEAGEGAPQRGNEQIIMPDRVRFTEAMGNASKAYKAECHTSIRMAKTHGVPQINSNPELAHRFYEAQGKISAYETLFHGLGHSKLLQRLETEIKEEL